MIKNPEPPHFKERIDRGLFGKDSLLICDRYTAGKTVLAAYGYNV
jgi:hypothetical protein